MGTPFALSMALATGVILVLLTVLKRLYRAKILREQGEEAANRSNELGRSAVLFMTASLMIGFFFIHGQRMIAVDMMAAVY